MSRRKTSPFEDLIEIASRLPWWLGLALAATSYFALHWYANSPLPPSSTDPGKMFEVVGLTMWRTFAMFGQYLMPFVLTFGAGVAAWKSRKLSRLADDVRDDPTASALNRMHWREFELVVGEAFRRRGFAVTERGGAGADCGVDLVIRNGSESTVVQSKQYRATQVGIAIVRELFGARTAEGAFGLWHFFQVRQGHPDHGIHRVPAGQSMGAAVSVSRPVRRFSRRRDR